MLEKSRSTMQSQFDEWYANLHARGIDAFEYSLANQVADASQQGKAMGSPRGGGVNAPTRAESKVSDEEVNDDIMAFYQAKDELLKRKAAR